MPFLHALWYDQQRRAQARQAGPRAVLAVSDSAVTVRCGNRQYARRANRCLWAALDVFEGNGYAVRWRHVRRNANSWVHWLDAVAEAAAGQAFELDDLNREVAIGTLPW